ncbi:MAG: lysophospholipid acyltransferase family protein [Verrucomicrobiota bacterium]|nr:lysophospholipid acyltransferase family protein [Verrucomicrobiota bacterium]
MIQPTRPENTYAIGRDCQDSLIVIGSGLLNLRHMNVSMEPNPPVRSLSQSELPVPETPVARAEVRPVTQLKWHQHAMLRIAATVMRIWTRTLRFEMDAEELATLTNTEQPVVFILWHNRLFTAGEIYRRYRKRRTLCALISASRDGAWLSALFGMLGIKAARGSSSRRGLNAARELIAELREGNDVGITPDGPRGPCYDFKEGAAMITEITQSPIIMVSVAHSPSNSWRVSKSWDGFWLPHPFARLRVHCRRMAGSTDVNWPSERTEAARQLRERLLEITDDGGSTTLPVTRAGR